MPKFCSLASAAVAIGSSQRDRFPLRIAVSVLLTAFNAGVIARFVTLLGLLVRVWIITLLGRPR